MRAAFLRRLPGPALLVTLCIGTASGAATASAQAERPELLPLPAIADAAFEPAVREQLAEARRRVEALLGRDQVAPADLAGAYGALGELYLLYDLGEAAGAALENASRLAPREARWLYLLGTLRQLDRDYPAAADLYDRVLALRPGDLAAKLRQADSLRSAGESSAASAVYREVLASGGERGPYAAAAHYGLGRLLLAAGDAEGARAELERTLELQPSAGEARYHLALALRDLGETERARELLRQPRTGAVRFPDPIVLELQREAQGVGALLALGRISLGEGELEEAERRFREALEIDPGSAAAHRSLASVLQRRGRRDEALEEYERALELEPEAAGLRYFVAGLLVDRARSRWQAEGEPPAAGWSLEQLEGAEREAARSDLERAAEHLELALRQAPDFVPAWVELAGARSGLGDLEAAIDALARALALRPEATDLRLSRARLLARNGATDEAVTEYDRIAAGGSELVRTARFEAAALLARAGRTEAAAARYRAIAEGAESALEEGLARFHLGNVLLQRGDRDGAIRELRAAVGLAPELPEAHFNLATLLGRAGRFREAAAEHAEVVALQPENHEARFGEAMAWVLAGEYAKAVARLLEALELYPSEAGYAHLLARIRAAAPDAAVRDGEEALELAARLFQALPTPDHAETVAMAFAEMGRFDKALEWQQRVVEGLRDAGAPEERKRAAEERLELYRAGRPVRSPWSSPRGPEG